MPVFQSKIFNKFPEIVYGTASVDYQPLTFRGNKISEVIKARKRFLRSLGLDLRQLVLSNQVHGIKVKEVNNNHSGSGVFSNKTYISNTDGLVTDQANLVLGVFTSDCIPALLYDPKTSWLGILHVGWKGAVQGIVSEAVRILKTKGVDIKNLHVWLGPSICGKCYSIKDAKRLNLLEKRLQFKSRQIKNKDCFDLKRGVEKSFFKNGVGKKNIELSKACSYENRNLTSARRDGYELHKNTLTVIARKSDYNLTNKKVLVYGLGIQGGGEASVKYAVKEKAQVTVFDKQSKSNFLKVLSRLKALPVKYYFGKINTDVLKQADIVIKNPGVDPNDKKLKILKKQSTLITNDISLFRANSKNPVIAITGTKGKTTTATWLNFLINKKSKSVLAGNLKLSPLLQPRAFNNAAPVIFELSSFQLEDLTLPLAPKIAIITNLYPDHLNRHKTITEYAKIKAKVFNGQSKSDIAILPLDSEWKNFNKISTLARIYWTSLKYQARSSGWIENNQIIIKPKTKKIRIVAVNQMKLKDAASVRNAVNVALAGYLFGTSLSEIRKSLKNFSGVDERYELIRKYKTREFINNTTATNPVAAKMALLSLKNKGIVICGGSDKKLPMGDFISMLNLKARIVITLPGTATDKIWPTIKVRKLKSNSMPEAVNLAWKLSKPTETIILNPGAASFGLFKNEFDRGGQFVKAVKKIK
jgi:UDP-N-acetylmuramoylalanine--D-glutamate ligase